MARAVNPSGSGPANGSGSGATSAASSSSSTSTKSNYLQQCREDNPEPEKPEDANSVKLSNCRITTDPDKLATDQPFEMAVDATGSGKDASGTVTFSLFCCTTDSSGNESCQDQSSPSQGTISNDMAKAKGTLVSPKDPAPAGAKLKYYVVAEHPNATEKAESPKVEVEAKKPPKPLAVWSLGAVHFGFDSSFLLPSCAAQMAEFQKVLDQNPKAAAAVFGHADPVGDDDFNIKLAGRRAYSVYGLLTRNIDGWIELSSPVNGDDWGTKSVQAMLLNLKGSDGSPYYAGKTDGIGGAKTDSAIKAYQKDNSLQVDGQVGPQTKAKLYGDYMDSICGVKLAAEDFVGDPNDEKRQWACVGCSEFNPVLVFSTDDDNKFKSSGDKSARNAKNAPNRRATLLLFPESTRGPGNIEFPCPAWTDGTSKCKKQFFDDSDARRNPSGTERTWAKDKNTFACKFYADIAEEKASIGSRSVTFHIQSNNDTEDEQEYTFQLASDSSSYSRTQSLKIPPGPDPATLELRFDQVPSSEKFTMRATPGNLDSYAVFEGQELNENGPTGGAADA